MVDSGTATLISAIGALVIAEGGAVLVWGGAIGARVKRTEEDVKPVTSLRLEMAVLSTKLDRLSRLLDEKEALR